MHELVTEHLLRYTCTAHVYAKDMLFVQGLLVFVRLARARIVMCTVHVEFKIYAREGRGRDI